METSATIPKSSTTPADIPKKAASARRPFEWAPIARPMLGRRSYGDRFPLRGRQASCDDPVTIPAA